MPEIIRRKLGLAAAPGPDEGEKKGAKRGLVLGELLVAFLLLAVAISSLTALMYSVTRDPRARTHDEVACTERGSATTPKCELKADASSGSKLLRSGCAARKGSNVQACNDSALNAQVADATIIRSRTDSAALAMLPKKTTKRTKRPDLGFVR